MNKKKMFVTYSEKLILEKVDLGGCYRSIFHNKKSVWAHGLTMKYTDVNTCSVTSLLGLGHYVS